MRVTQSLLLRNQSASISAAYGRLFEVQAQLSSGRRLLAPSDDPAAVRPALDARTGRSRLAQTRRSADLAAGELGSSDGALRNMSELIARAREIAVEGANGTLAQSDRDGIAIEVDGLLAQLVQLANTRSASGHLFAGGRKGAAPFETVSTAQGTVVLYRGDGGATTLALSDSLSIDLDLPGAQVFGIGARGATQYSGVTGAAPGGGNDSARGTARLAVAHTRTVLGDGALGGTGDSVSGLRAGASSAAGDTVLGSAGAWTLTLVDTSGTGSAGTVSLNGGPAVAWTSADLDLAVTAPGGEVVHLDLSGVAAGFAGVVGAAGEGTLSLDGGLTATAIDFTSANQIVTDSRTGGSVFVDGRGIVRAGGEVLRFPGTYDLFAALVELRESLRNADGEAQDVQLARVRETIGELARGQDLLLGALATVGARSRLVETTRARADELDLLLAARQSSLEDADFAAGTLELSQAQLALQAGIALSARIAELPSLVTLL